MCSGCSDYYEGDEEASAEPFSAKSEQQDDDWSAPEHGAKRPGGGARWRQGSWEAGRQPVGRAPGEREDYEVLVSANCIIERRRIQSNSCVFNTQFIEEEMEIWRAKQWEREQFRGWSATSYQTQRQFERKLHGCRNSDGMSFVFWGIAGAATLVLAVWLAAG